ncbi:MAG: response regulator [Flavobacteriales bacterium]|nr:response regulator [Flavobacteriales bacterium]
MATERLRVLFVDDEERNLKAFRASFRREMDVLIAPSGQDALELLARENVHVIVSDQRMPGMSGSEFLAIARERHPHVMRMLLTGYSDLDAVVRAVNEGGIYAYATKPWDENDLRLRIHQAFEIQQLRAEKERLLDRYSQVFEATADPIVIVDQRGQVLDANAACAALIGVDRDDLRQRRFTEFLDDAKALIRSLKQHRSGRDFVNVDLTIRNALGAVIDCLMTATSLGPQGEHRNVFQAVIKDITDRKQEQKRLEKLNADLDRRVTARTSQLLEALEDLGSFSYSVAHDLRSPLKNIAAMSEMLRATALKNPALDDCVPYADRIERGAKRMIQLVDDLLRFSQTNTRALERKELDLRQLVREAVTDTVPDERMGQVSVNVEPGATALADAPMLKVALHNLLSNALKFTRNKELPSIAIDHSQEAEHDHIVVRDNGVGFDSRHKEQAFSAFKRLHKADQFEGTGVGLAIVQRIVGKHGGEVWAESTIGQGTSIHIKLPRSMSQQPGLPFVKVA